jgi:hypothetical protein
VRCARVWHRPLHAAVAAGSAPLIDNNYYTTSMHRIDTLSARPAWPFDPQLSFPVFLERQARLPNGRAGAGSELSRLSLVSDGPKPVRASVAVTASERAAASALVESRYAWRGYAVQPDDARSAMILVATRGTAAVGTLTLHADGPGGLAADEGYGAAIDAARASGRRVCELTRLAIDVGAAWQPTLGVLVGLSYIAARVIHQVTDVFVEVNPRHARFYQRMFGFVAAAGQRICPRVAAPAVLLRLELQRFDAMVERFGGWHLARPAMAAAA